MAINPNLIFLTFPIGSVVAYGVDRWPQLSRTVEATPRAVRDMISSQHTAAFLRGLGKTSGLPVTRVPRIAWAVLQVAIGEKTLAQLPSLLSTSLQLANDKAQAMANEIEKRTVCPSGLGDE